MPDVLIVQMHVDGAGSPVDEPKAYGVMRFVFLGWQCAPAI